MEVETEEHPHDREGNEVFLNSLELTEQRIYGQINEGERKEETVRSVSVVAGIVLGVGVVRENAVPWANEWYQT